MIRKQIAYLVALSLALGPALDARTRKGDKLLKEGQLAEATRDFDKALDAYEQALQEDPADGQYQLRARRVRFQAGQAHSDKGMKLRSEGKLEEAVAEFQRAFAIDPSSGLAQGELSRTLQMLEDQKREESKGAPKKSGNERGMTSGEKAEAEMTDRISKIEGVPVLKPVTREISMLRMNNQPARVLFETLGKLAGINIVLDPEYQATGRNYTIDLMNTTLEQGLDNIAVLTKSYWKPITENSVFVTNDNPTKRRDYEDLVVKSFYLKNITTPQELAEISTIVRSITDARRVFTINHLSAFVVRGTLDQVILAEKLVNDLDKPKSEVVVDVYVMEVSRSRTRDLAATLVSGGINGLRLPIGYSPRAGLGPGGTAGLSLANIGKISTGDFSLTLPGATLQALMSDRGTRVLQSPQVRATDSVKSSLKIGDRYPYATGSFQPGIGTSGGVSPLVSTQFQFADVGVNVDITPKIHSAEEVSLQVEIDLSNIRDRIDVGGLSQPVIGQRKISHNVRIRQGDVTVIGGLMQDQETKSVSGIPGLGNIPILGRLFSGESVAKDQNELLVALVPHIVRSMDLTELNLRRVSAGSEQVVKLSYAPLPEPEGGPAANAPRPAASAPAVVAPVAIPAAKPENQPAPGLVIPAGAQLKFVPPMREVNIGETVSVLLNIENVTDLYAAPLKITFDSARLRLTDVAAGPMMGGDGQQPIFSRNILNDRGEATVILNRMPGAPGVSGGGGLVSLVFQAAAQGQALVQVAEPQFRNSRQEAITASAPMAMIVVK
jgi:general secretion pathway protein D